MPIPTPTAEPCSHRKRRKTSDKCQLWWVPFLLAHGRLLGQVGDVERHLTRDGKAVRVKSKRGNPIYTTPIRTTDRNQADAKRELKGNSVAVLQQLLELEGPYIILTSIVGNRICRFFPLIRGVKTAERCILRWVEWGYPQPWGIVAPSIFQLKFMVGYPCRLR